MQKLKDAINSLDSSAVDVLSQEGLERLVRDKRHALTSYFERNSEYNRRHVLLRLANGILRYVEKLLASNTYAERYQLDLLRTRIDDATNAIQAFCYYEENYDNDAKQVSLVQLERFRMLTIAVSRLLVHQFKYMDYTDYVCCLLCIINEFKHECWYTCAMSDLNIIKNRLENTSQHIDENNKGAFLAQVSYDMLQYHEHEMQQIIERQEQFREEKEEEKAAKEKAKRKEGTMEKEDEQTVTCYQCGEVVDKDDAVFCEGDWYCPDCEDNYITTCDICGEKHWIDNTNWIESEEIEVCDDCYDRYFTVCDCCRNTVRKSDITTVQGQDYCQSCYDAHCTTCADCGEEIMIDEAIWDEDTEEYYCDTCWENAHNVIKKYHDESVKYRPLVMPDENPDSVFLIGIEHEVAGDEEYAVDVDEEMNGGEQRVTLMRDCSVDGFEIVSNPMSLRYFRDEFFPMYKETMKNMEIAGMTGEDEGGIHLHFNKLGTSTQVARLCNIIYGGSQDDMIAWRRLSRRTESSLNSWASISDRCRSTMEIVKNDDKTCSTNRRTALNYDAERTHTWELRLFNSTLDPTILEGYVEILVSLVDYVNLNTNRGFFTTTYDWIEYVIENKDVYPSAYRAICERQLPYLYGFNVPDCMEAPVPDSESAEWARRITEEIFREPAVG